MGSKNVLRTGPTFGLRFLKPIELPQSTESSKTMTRPKMGLWVTTTAVAAMAMIAAAAAEGRQFSNSQVSQSVRQTAGSARRVLQLESCHDDTALMASPALQIVICGRLLKGNGNFSTMANCSGIAPLTIENWCKLYTKDTLDGCPIQGQPL